MSTELFWKTKYYLFTFTNNILKIIHTFFILNISMGSGILLLTQRLCSEVENLEEEYAIRSLW